MNWLREKARAERWREELILVQYELRWTRAFFQYHSAKWVGRKVSSVGGARAYARREGTTIAAAVSVLDPLSVTHDPISAHLEHFPHMTLSMRDHL